MSIELSSAEEQRGVVDFQPSNKIYRPLDIARSHTVQYLQITIPNEILNEAIRNIGDCGRLHVVDISNTSTGDISKYIMAYKKRATDLQDLDKKLSQFQEQCKSRDVPLDIPDLSKPLGVFGEQLSNRNPDLLVGANEFIQELESRLLNNIAFERNVKQEIARRAELGITLEAAARLVPNTISAIQGNKATTNHDMYEAYVNQNDADADADAETSNDSPLSSYICGVLPLDSIPMFARLVYRTSKGGNAVTRFETIEEPLVDPNTNIPVKKAVFCVATIGRQLYRRITKLCPLVNATVYPITTFDPSFVSSEKTRLENEIREQENTLLRTSGEIKDILATLSAPQVIDGAFGPSILHTWKQLLHIEKCMIDVLMQCAFHATFVVLGAWVPSDFIEDLTLAIDRCADGGNGAKPMIDYTAEPLRENSVPPTYIPTTTFTAPFQAMVNTYGTPRYKEFNPAMIAIATFPFIFGVMFGDMGHGIILFLFASLLISQTKVLEEQRRAKTINEMVEMMYGARFFIVMMSLMAMYCGFIYNDFMAVPTNVFGTRWNASDNVWEGVYPFGLDPSWYHKANTLKFLNSFKMKMAVILGVIHMTSGMLWNLFNHIYFNDLLSILFEWIPRMIFLMCTFGWMITMIFIKWCIDWDVPERGIHNAPSLIQTMIDMFLSPGKAISPASELFPGQSQFQVILLLLAVINIPLMWVVKPLVEFKKMHAPFLSWLHSPVDDEREQEKRWAAAAQELDAVGFSEHSIQHMDHSSSSEGEEPTHGHSFGDVIVHHSIHTIEYILGTVSNTASYLRLWALSLAHAQLSEVFWTKMMSEYGFLGDAPGQAFFGAAIWGFATFGVIVCMDALECFLHCLRLHWVESMNKHYYGDGIPFKTFTFVPDDN